MDKFFLALALLSMIGVVASLLAGLRAMAKNAPETSQKMMQWRIKLQGAALLFLFLAYSTKS